MSIECMMKSPQEPPIPPAIAAYYGVNGLVCRNLYMADLGEIGMISLSPFL